MVTQAAPDAAYFAIGLSEYHDMLNLTEPLSTDFLETVDAAGLAYATAATAAYDAAFSITGVCSCLISKWELYPNSYWQLPLAAPALAAETTYATATVMAA